MVGGEFGFRISTVAVAAIIFFAGCGGTRPAGLRSQFVDFNPEQKAEYEAAKPREYRIQEGDELGLIFFYLEEMNQRGIIVLPDGSVTLPGIDRVVVAGLTVSEADSIISAHFAKSYRNPDISLLVEKSVGRRVYVLGEVREPGLHAVPHGGIGIMSAIGTAGGFTEDAKKSNTVLVRMTEQGYLCQEIDLDRFHTVEGISYSGVGLETYDVIYVPRSKVGDFAYFSKSILSGLLDISRIVSDVRYIESLEYRR